MSLMLVHPNDHPHTFKPVSLDNLVYFPHEFELTGKSLLETQQSIPAWPERPDYDIGIPSVEKASTDNDKKDCQISDAWAWYLYDLILMRVQEMKPYLSLTNQKAIAKLIFRSGTRDNAFLTNKAGSTTHRDPINGNNLEAESMKLEPIVCGGNRGLATSGAFWWKGALVRKVKCLDGSKPPPRASDVNYHTHPHLILWATIETRIPTLSGGREIRPFEFQGIKGFPYFILVWQRDYFLFDTNRLKPI